MPDTKLTSCFVLSQAVAAGMVARRRGKIINICSVQHNAVRATTVAYAVARAGLGNLTKICAEWAASGVQANGGAPGYICTERDHGRHLKLAPDPDSSRQAAMWAPGPPGERLVDRESHEPACHRPLTASSVPWGAVASDI